MNKSIRIIVRQFFSIFVDFNESDIFLLKRTDSPKHLARFSKGSRGVITRVCFVILFLGTRRVFAPSSSSDDVVVIPLYRRGFRIASRSLALPVFRQHVHLSTATCLRSYLGTYVRTGPAVVHDIPRDLVSPSAWWGRGLVYTSHVRTQ